MSSLTSSSSSSSSHAGGVALDGYKPAVVLNRHSADAGVRMPPDPQILSAILLAPPVTGVLKASQHHAGHASHAPAAAAK